MSNELRYHADLLAKRTGTARLYIADGIGVYRVSQKALKAIEAGAEWPSVCRELSSEYNYTTERWTNLPEGVQDGGPGDSRLESCSASVAVIQSDDV